jgi:hypothetical protein
MPLPKGYATPLSRVYLQTLIVTQLINTFLAFYGTRSFAAPYTEPGESSLQPHIVCLRYILILSVHQ